jgi:putative PIN family toxin of toxin-antitoxin system
VNRRIVVDTNVYVSRALRGRSTPGAAIDKAWNEDVTLLSSVTWAELQIVLRRPKLSPYILPGTLEPYLQRIFSIATLVSCPTPIRACRDPKDDKFLEVAFHGAADVIVTGDRDLLDLHPFRGVAIITPAAYLDAD